ncbi:hypothetical protein [Listeria sp. PSOL-1]|uniref:hypothetical protein n=1 Tax=Listeria sp. PSOL-1 TaxID=1844999 RepID=UPI0013D3CFDE|nr:hypothetical protein [Listeria sp. PSOL-1]
MKKKILVVVFAILLGVSMCISQNAHAVTNQRGNKKEITKKTVISIFKAQSTSDDMDTRITAERNLDIFDSLSETKQKEFVEALNDPKKLEEKTVVEVEDTTPDPSNKNIVLRASTSRKNVGKNFSYKLVGVKMYGLHLDVSYQVSKGQVQKTIGSTAYCTYSYNPLVKVDLITKTNYVSHDKQGYARAKFRYAIGPFKGMSAQICVRAVSVAGNGKGQLSYWNDWREG